MHTTPLALIFLMLAADPIPAPPPAVAPLAGPRVETGVSAPTLIERDEHAMIRRLDIRPEEAALDKLGLNEAVLARARKVIDDRAIALDRVLNANKPLVERIGPAYESGNEIEGAALLVKLHALFSAEVGPTPLVESVARELPEPQATLYRKLVKDYTDAVVKDLTKNKPEMNKPGLGRSLAKLGARSQMNIEHFVIELQLSGERVFNEKDAIDAEVEKFLAKMKFPEAREDEIRAIFKDWVKTLNGEPTKRQLADMLLKIYDTLDEPQKRTFFETVIMSED